MPDDTRSRPSVGIATGKLDQFESVFRAASKTIFEYQSVDVDSVLVVSDQDAYQADLLTRQLQEFLSALARDSEIEWRVVHGSDFDSVPDLLAIVEDARPDLVCTYRHLHSESWRWPYTLGEYVDVLSQVTTTPVMVLPHPEARRATEHALADTGTVMAITDHLTGDARLVNYAVRFTRPDGTLFLTHVEDEATFERYIDVIGKIPSIVTDAAREEILDQLLDEPRDYIRSCREVLQESGLVQRIEEVVTVGHRLSEYAQLIEQHAIDLLVFNTKDEDQLAMHGLAYPLAIELRQIPLLML